MPRYASQNLAAIDPEFRKSHGIGQGGGDPKKRRYAYGKSNNVLVAQGAELFANGFTLRLMPLYDEAAKDEQGNRQFVNFREGEVFGDWCRLFTCANWVGNPGICFVIHDGNEELNLYESPYHILRNVAWDNSSNSKRGIAHPTLGRLFDELLSKNFVPNSHVGSLRKPEKTLFVSASGVYLNEQGQAYLGAFSDENKKNARIIGLKTSAAQSLHSALAVRDEATNDFVSGDMLSFGAGKLITFLPETYAGDGKNRPALSVDGPTGVKMPKYAQQSRQVLVGYPPSRSSMTHFAVIHDQYNGQDVTLEPYAEKLVADSKSWDEYMYFPTYEEQAEMLAQAFPREALEYAWQNHPEYLRTLPRGTTTVDMSDRNVEDLEEHDAPAPRQSFTRPAAAAPSRPTGVAPAAAAAQDVTTAGELSEDEEAGVDNMFASASPTSPPPRVPANTADIIARARAAASRNR